MKKIKIAIQHRVNSHTERWIEYCNTNNISYKLVDCSQTDIIEQLKDCDGLMWHWGHQDYRYQQFARQLTISLEMLGKKVFPNSNSSWHYDDKIGQKYLLEALEAPIAKTFTFYSKKEALEWTNKTTFPKVFKLKGGSGSINVELINNKRRAKQIVRIAFGRGFSLLSRKKVIKDKFYHFKKITNTENLIGLMKSFIRLFFPTRKRLLLQRQKGYVLFQDFAAGNTYDTRVIVVGDKCFAGRRYVRDNDFRASGSGLWGFDKELFDERCIKIAFDTSEKIGSQVMAYDFIFDKDEPKIVEISYATCLGPYDKCIGHWDREMNWYPGKFKQQIWMIEDFINEIQQSKSVK